MMLTDSNSQTSDVVLETNVLVSRHLEDKQNSVLRISRLFATNCY